MRTKFFGRKLYRLNRRIVEGSVPESLLASGGWGLLPDPRFVSIQRISIHLSLSCFNILSI